MRLLILTLEFSLAAFSGNGIYAQSQVRALRALGHRVLVICGCPVQSDPAAPTVPAAAPTADLIAVPLSRWGILDHHSGWKEFAAGAASAVTVKAVTAFRPQAALGIDWHSLPAFEALRDALRTGGFDTPVLPYVYMNYRVYTRSTDADERDLARRLEAAAVAAAAEVVTLSRADAEFVSREMSPDGICVGPKVLLPALRDDMARLPLPADVAGSPDAPLTNGVAATDQHDGADAAQTHGQCSASGLAAAISAQQDGHDTNGIPAERRRRYLTCCVRLSPEKEPHRFVELVEILARTGELQRLGITPLLCGAAATPYAEALRKRLHVTAPDAVIERRFLGPADLAEVYAATALNFHPCVYDAYGMTIVEAASQGAPSVVAVGGTVGATDLLNGDHGEAFLLDFGASPERLAKQVTSLLQHRQLLQATGIRASARARGWTEEANAKQLLSLVKAAVGKAH